MRRQHYGLNGFTLPQSCTMYTEKDTCMKKKIQKRFTIATKK